MSITINGATNTITAASGLAIAGNTAVNGTLGVTGALTGAAGSFTTLSATGASSSTGVYSFGSATNYGRRLLATTFPTIYENNTEGAYYLGIGAKHYGGGTWTPDSTSAAAMIADGSGWGWYTNTGLTGGVNYSITPRMTLSSTALTLGTGVDLVMASATTVRLGGYTVATLPAAGTAGRTAYVTDATAPTYLGALTGGGAVVCPVFDNGVAWVSA